MGLESDSLNPYFYYMEKKEDNPIMAGKITYRIGIEGDTSKLQASLQQALQSLNKISTLSTGGALTQDMREAAKAAQQLNVYLQSATTSTGKIDLSKFSASLKAGGLELKDYANKLQAIGPAGEKAFLEVASAISKAELPIRRTSKLLDGLWTTMKNTVRWQLTSSTLHGFMGALNTAFGYSKDLNRSLNSIQIVTNKATEDMGKFAENANKAAKALSTTTTEYTDASLIYYQQGLSDQEVEGRTNTTIKLANVARESAEQASEQMTAIWNNFYDGSKSLEYYADVMTALGASTASSTQEISAGLQKFAAIAESVGLSYEYAAAALATVTATTRESADVVGTAYRTLFARIQGLLQDEEQDDGTNLNKYSKALAAVGINIKDTSGELKGMNQILDEMGAKWDNLSKAQQLALAQTVAGVRQYTQLIALMDNWDFFQENLVTAMGSEGSLEQQAQIYAKSWEAARDRVKAASEDIYDSIINPQMFIDADDALTPILTGVANIVDAMGGLKGILVTTGYAMTALYGDKIAQSIRDMIYNVSVLSGKELERQRTIKATVAALAEQMALDSADSNSRMINDTQIQAQKVVLQNQLNEKAKELSSIQYEQLKNEIALVEQIGQAAVAYGESASQAENRADIISSQLILADKTIYDFSKKTAQKLQQSLKQSFKSLGGNKALISLNDIIDTKDFKKFNLDNILTGFKDLNKYKGNLIELKTQFQGLKEGISMSSPEVQKLADEFKKLTGQNLNISDINSAVEQLDQQLDLASISAQQLSDIMTGKMQVPASMLKQLADEAAKAGNNTMAATLSTQAYKQELDNITKAIETSRSNIMDWSNKIVAGARALASVGMAIQSIKNLGSIWNDDDAELGDKIIQTMTSLGMIIPSLITAYQGLTGTLTANTLAKVKNMEADAAVSYASSHKIMMAIAGVTVAKDAETGAVIANTAAWYANPVIWGVALLVGGIALITGALNAQAKALEETTQRTIDHAKSTKEELDSNTDLIQNTQQILDLYKEHGDNKDQLDEKTRALADAYDLEGAALAKLTGQYEDYDNVIKLAREKQHEELLKTLNSQEEAVEASALKVLAKAREGSGHLSGNFYDLPLGGGDRESEKVIDILRKYMPERSRQLGSSSGELMIDANDPQEMLKLYDQFNQTIDEANRTMTVLERTNSGAYQNIVKWRDKMSESIEEYRQLVDNVNEIRLRLNSSLSDENIDDFKSFKEWAEKAKEEIAGMGYEGDKLEKMFNTLVASSTNPAIQSFKELYDVINDIKNLVNDPALRDNIESIVSSEKYDENILALISWGSVTNETWKSAYKVAEQYYNALEKINQGQKQLEDVQSIRDAIKNGEDIDFEKLSNVLSNAEGEIVEFSSFLRMSVAEQDRYLRELTIDAYQSMLQGQIESIYSQKENIALSNEFLATVNSKELDKAYEITSAWKEAAQARIEYNNALNNNDIEFDAEKYADSLNTIGYTIEQLNELSDEDFSNKMNEATESYQQFIDTVNSNQNAIDSANNGIIAAKESIRILTYEFAFSFDSVSDFKEAIQDVPEAMQYFTEAAIALDKALDIESLDKEELIEYTDYLKEAADEIDNLNDNLDDVDAETIAKGIMKMNDAIEELANNFEDWYDILNNSTESSEEFFNAMDNTRDAVSKLLDISKDFVSSNFIQDNLELIKEAATGSAEAIDQLKQNLSEQIIINIVGVDRLEDLPIEIMTQWQWLQDYLANTNFELGPVNDQAFIDALNNLVVSTGMTVDQVNALCDSMGFEAKWEKSSIPYETKVPITSVEHVREVSEYDEHGNPIHWIDKEYPTVTDYVANSGSYDAFAVDVAADGKPATPKISGLTKKATGSYNNYSSSNAGGGSPGKSSGGSKKGKTHKPEEKKDIKDIQERYHEINRQIKRQNDLLDDVGNAVDRAYGGSKLKGFSSQLSALQRQQENYLSKLAEAENYLDQDLSRLQGLFDNIQLDANGEILNYSALLEQTVNEHNAFIEQYNAFLEAYSAMTQAEQEANEAAYNAWVARKEMMEQTFQARQDALKQYESTLDTIQEMRDAIEDNLRAQADAKLSQVEYKLEIVLDVKEMKDALREFDKQVNEIFGDALTHGLSVANLDRDQAQAEADMYPEYKRQYDELVNLYNTGDQYMDKERIIEDIQDLQGKVLGSAEAIVEWVNSIEDLIPDAIDAARERYNLFTDQLEHNTTVLDTVKELYTLQGTTYKTMEGFNRLQKVSQERLESQLAQSQLQRAWYDEARVRFEEAQARLDSLNGDESDLRYDTYKKERDALLEEMNEAEESYLSLAKDAMETAQAMYEEQLEKAVYDFGQIVSNGVGLDLLQDKYDHYIETNGRYLDKVNEAYQTTAWFNKLQQDIDKATNSATRDRLKALQEEINIRRENNKLSQYDLDILNAKYEVLQAQMALEDAQNAKNQLQLVRDSQGNWNYQYTADQDQVANAQQELLDKENEWYNIAKQQVTDVTGEIIATWQECQEKIREIYSDMTLTDEERADRAAEIYSYYTDKIKYLEEEKQIAISDMTEAGNANLFAAAVIMGDELTDLTGMTSDDIQAIVQQGGDDVIGLLTKDNETIKNIIASNTNLIDLFDNVYARDLNNMTITSDKFESALQKTLDRAQSDYDKFRDKVIEVADKTGTSLDKLDEKTNEVAYSTDRLRDSGLEASQALWNMIDVTINATQGYLNMAQSIWATVEALRALAAAQASFVESQANSGDFDGSGYGGGGSSSGGRGSGGSGNTGGGNGLSNKSIDEQLGIAYAIWNGTAGWGNGADRRKNIESKFGAGAYETYQGLVNDYDIKSKAASGAWTKDIGVYSYDELRRKYGISAYASGGYTGDFSDAKLAFLHEKELVLNQDDTKNILATVGIARDIFSSIEKAIDGNSIAAMALMAERLGMSAIPSTHDSIEQTIHIDEVSFPNITSADGLEEAFRALPDRAKQWSKIRKD